MNRLMSAVALTGLAGLAVAATGCDMDISIGGATAKTETLRYEVPQQGLNRLDVKLNSADVEIVGTNTNKVTVQEVLKYTKSNKPKPRHWTEGNTLMLRYSCPKGIRVGFNRCDVQYKIQVPQKFAVKADNDSGKVTINGAQGRVEAKVDSGRLTATNLGGAPVTADVDSGNIRLTGAGDLNISVDSGSLRTEDLRAKRITVNADSGGITLGYLRGTAAPDSIDVTISSGNVNMLLPPVPAGYDIKTTEDSGRTNVAGILDKDGSPHLVKAVIDSGNINIEPAPAQ